jgi:anti-sigma regulatory factor (Ser/Thr protein kinase)/predicted ArsR family transcriptional regulator
MDWYLDGTDARAGSELRRELMDYLRRHAVADSDLAGAELAAAELIGNAIRHAPGPAWVHLDWGADEPVIEVHDLGPGFVLRTELPEDPLATGGRGLMITHAVTGELRAAAKRAGGSRVTTVLPVRRAREDDHDPPRTRSGRLPSDEEARPDGTFGKESFLRALVVQLAETVEHQQGPAAAEAAIAQVGMDVGGQMEAQYRRLRGIVDALGPEQIADLYVRLKAAIDGDFYVVEANEERIVLGNRACPFGDVVRRAPGLCRMTSSVFGGIAARNTGGASVVLEERIAVGDPECRVVVWLSGRHRGQFRAAHDYGTPPAESVRAGA